MKTVEKKIWPEYFDAVASGRKKFELRLNDFDLEEGDTLKLREWDPKTKEYTGREVSKKVTYVKVFQVDDLFGQSEEIKKKGLKGISLE